MIRVNNPQDFTNWAAWRSAQRACSVGQWRVRRFEEREQARIRMYPDEPMSSHVRLAAGTLSQGGFARLGRTEQEPPRRGWHRDLRRNFDHAGDLMTGRTGWGWK